MILGFYNFPANDRRVMFFIHRESPIAQYSKEHLISYHSFINTHYSFRPLKKSGVATEDLVKIYCSLIRSVLEYAAPVWSDLPDYLVSVVESIQKKALKIILPTYDYAEAMNVTGLQCLSARGQQTCIKFVDQAIKE